MKKLTKEEWLNTVPETIYKLKKNYGFYYSCYPCRITKDILEIASNSKHKHKVVVYTRGQRYFFVIYRKNDFDIYFTNEYVNDKNYNRQSYFLKKFKRAYKKAEVEYDKERTDYGSQSLEPND